MTETARTKDPRPSSHVKLRFHQNCIIDQDKDAYVCENNAHDHYRLCKARAAHDSVFRNPDAFLAKKSLPATTAPHFKFQYLITKVDGFAKVVDLDFPTILQEQLKDPVVCVVRSWIQGGISLDLGTSKIRESKGLLRYCQEVNRLHIEERGHLLCYNEPSDTLDEEHYESVYLYLSS